MNIEITSQEYRDLLDILHLADVVISGHRREEDTRSARHRALIRKLYSLAPAEGLERLMSRDVITQSYTPTAEFEENTIAHVLINEFSDHLFWDELVNRLSMRDAAESVGGINRLNSLSDSERQNLEGPLRQKYIEEFTRNSVTNLVVVERFDVDKGVNVRTSD